MLFRSNTSIDISSVITDMEAQLEALGTGELFGLWFQLSLIHIEVLTDEDVMDILKQAFSQSGMKEIVAESVKGRVAGESLTE